MQFTAALMGVNFRDANVRELVAGLAIGESGFGFERDPENRYDPNAIKVLYAGELFIGFIEKEVAEQIAPLMDEGYEVSGKIIDFLGGTIKPFLKLEVTLDERDEMIKDESEDDESDEA